MMETVISGFIDAFPAFLRPKKTLFTFILCVIGFLLGMPQVCKVCQTTIFHISLHPVTHIVEELDRKRQGNFFK